MSLKNFSTTLLRLLTASLLILLGMSLQSRYQLLQQRNNLSRASLSKIQLESHDQLKMPQFWEAYAYLKRDYLDANKLKDQKQLVDGATAGLVASLGDPYTLYLPPKENKRSTEDLAGKFYGVGIELGYKEATLAVVAPLADSPAAKAGIKAGDLILKVKDPARHFEEKTTNWSLNKAVEEIRGPKDSQVILTLYRQGTHDNKPFDVTIKRGEIVVKTVKLKFLTNQGKRVAYIRLMRFGGNTDQEWNQAVKQILAKKGQIQGIVLDLRNNPGGFFNEAINVASTFIPSGVIVKQQGRYSNQVFKATGKAKLAHIPLIVLVNKGSASAAEIVAGALRDDLHIKLVGENTFGKGTVQDVRDLSNGGGMHITVARWILPNGDWINKKGIAVEIPVNNNPKTKTDEVLNRAIKAL